MRLAPEAAVRWIAPSFALSILLSAPVAFAQGSAPDAGTEAESDADADTDADTDADAEAEAPVLEPGADAQTGIRGRIVAGDTQRGLEGAPVLVEGRGGVRPVMTAPDGSYQLFLPPGRYSIRSYFDLYHGAQLGGVQVTRGRFTDASLTLDPITEDDAGVEEMEVAYRADTSSAIAQQNLRREQIGASDAVSAREIGRSGDSSASAAARRVVGVTVDNDNFLVVRGLGGRYSSVTLNGVLLPGTDPDRPGVQLDIFPTALLDSLQIYKTFRPDLPGTWAGGLMAIGTRSFPEERTLQLKLSAGYDTISTFQDRLDYDGGSRDWLGFDDGTRRLPDGFPEDDLLPVGSAYTRDERNAFGRMLSDVWAFERRRALPNLGLGATFGNSHRWGDQRRLGYLFTINYSSYESRRVGVLRPDPEVFPEGTPTDCPDPVGPICPQSSYSQEVGQLDVLWGTLATASLQLGPDHELTALGFFNRSATDTTTYRTGFHDSTNATTDSWQLRFLGRTILFNQLLGDHRNLFGTRVRLRWNGVYSLGRRDEPDSRSVTYDHVTGTPSWNTTATRSGERFFSNLRQSDVGGGASLRFPLWQEGWGTIGTQITFSERDFLARRFKYQLLPGGNAALPPELLFCGHCQDTGIGFDTLFREERSLEPDAYDADQDLYASYAQLETPLGGRLRLLAGARVELFKQRIAARLPWPDEELPEGSLERRTDVDVLPAAQLVYRVSDEVYLRGGYGQTVIRPQARELAAFAYYDFVRSLLVSGNPDLERTRVHAADLRFEWFFGTADQTTELVAVSLFYKEFLDPIELQIQNPVDLSSKFVNAAGARNFGAEIEGQLGLGRIAHPLRFFTLGGNLALLYSRVRFTPEQAAVVTNETRPLFGQSPYVANLSLRFDEPATGIAASLVYNVVGPRLVAAGVVQGAGQSMPDQEQRAFHQLDLVASWEANDHLKLNLKAQNLLFEQFEVRAGGLVTQRFDLGATFTIGVDVQD